ncbi:hypothetical protein VNO77_21031 [Canavalia gladiata]|uniref:RING-type domain-containing protein n=1 Tax=Canavalia gladiata TaxID=3824 RepID=A0AAN9LTV8_CANGL
MSSPSPSISFSASLSAGITTISPPRQTITNLDTFTGLFLLFIFLCLFIRLCYVYMVIRHDQGHNPNTSTHHDDDDQNKSTGLPINIINSYHTFPYKTNVGTTYGHDTSCSICIADYKESEILRMMPQCYHYFHRDCVDLWLKVNASCPICRNSPLQASNISDCV